MALITLQVLEGMERGLTFEDLPTPVSIGREEDNIIRLNDERVSRFHVKIQQDGDRIILTDLESTNGTRINGHPVQMRVLQVGDQLSIGRCLLLFGSQDEIKQKAAHTMNPNPLLVDAQGSDHESKTISSSDQCINDDSFEVEMLELFPGGPPEFPTGLSPVHHAQLSDILAYAHSQIGPILDAATGGEEPSEEDSTLPVAVDWVTWQRLAKLQMDLATYLRKLSDP